MPVCHDLTLWLTQIFLFSIVCSLPNRTFVIGVTWPVCPSSLDPFCEGVWLGRVTVCFSGDLIWIAKASGPVWLLSRMSSSQKEQPAGDGAIGPLTLCILWCVLSLIGSTVSAFTVFPTPSRVCFLLSQRLPNGPPAPGWAAVEPVHYDASRRGRTTSLVWPNSRTEQPETERSVRLLGWSTENSLRVCCPQIQVIGGCCTLLLWCFSSYSEAPFMVSPLYLCRLPLRLGSRNTDGMPCIIIVIVCHIEWRWMRLLRYYVVCGFDSVMWYVCCVALLNYYYLISTRNRRLRLDFWLYTWLFSHEANQCEFKGCCTPDPCTASWRDGPLWCQWIT